MGTAVSALTVTETGLMGAQTSQRRHFVAGPFGTVTLPNHLRLMLNNKNYRVKSVRDKVHIKIYAKKFACFIGYHNFVNVPGEL